jgi:hypothetical protein
MYFQYIFSFLLLAIIFILFANLSTPISWAKVKPHEYCGNGFAKKSLGVVGSKCKNLLNLCALAKHRFQAPRTCVLYLYKQYQKPIFKIIMKVGENERHLEFLVCFICEYISLFFFCFF